MMSKRMLWLVVLVLAFAISPISSAFADGIIIPIPPPDVPIERIPMLTIKYHRVNVTIAEQVATTQIDQVFINESGYELEGTYIFPLPEHAAISEFAMYVDGERLEGEMLDRDEARRIYEDIVRKQKDPALLEYVGRNAFRARIYPIPPHGEKRVQLEYTEVLTMDNGVVRYVYPLDTERFSAKPIQDVSIHVEIKSGEAIKSIYSPSHDVAVDRRGDYHAAVGYEDVDVKPDTDFTLYYTVSAEDFGLNLMSYRPREAEDGYFLMLVAPAVDVDDRAVVAKDVVFVLDVSGSMRGEKLDQAKEALKFVLNSLNEEDRFNIIAFSTGLRRYAAGLRPATEREDALRFVQDVRASGGTDIERALVDALSEHRGGRPQTIIFLTDGLATEGVTDTQAIIDHVSAAATEDTRLFAFGIGDEVNTILLDTLAQDNRGTTNYVRPGQNIETEVSDFYAKISTPLLADLTLDFGDIMVEDTYPYPLPDLFVGSQLVLVGRYRHGGDTEVTLSGEVNGAPQRFDYSDVSFREKGGESFIARLWATRRVGYLLGQIRLHGEDDELVDEIVDLAVKYGIMTPYTSFLVREDVDVFDREARSNAARESFAIGAAPAMTGAPLVAAGKEAVDRAVVESQLQHAQSVEDTYHENEEVKTVAEKSFIKRGGVWIDTAYNESSMVIRKIGFGSDTYFAVLADHPEWGAYFSLGTHIIVVLDGQAYEILEGDFPVVELP